MINGAIMIASWTRSLILDTGTILLDREGSDELAREIHAAIEIDDSRISDLHVWRVGQDRYACILAVVAKTPLPTEAYKARLKEVHELVHVTVETNHCTEMNSA